MSGRLADKVAIVVGGGQTPGETIGNGRATAVLFAREGAKVLVVDRDLASARETVAQIESEGGLAIAHESDATRESDCAALIARCVELHGRVDVLHNNVGIGGGDAGPAHLEEEAWDRILEVNLKSVILPCKHVLPVLRRQRSGAIVNVSSIAAVCATPIVAYKVSKAGINAYTQSLAVGNAKHGIRANVIMPGLDGPAWVREAQRARPDIKVIFMSGYTTDDILREGIEMERVEFLQKPFMPEALARKVRGVFENCLGTA